MLSLVLGPSYSLSIRLQARDQVERCKLRTFLAVLVSSSELESSQMGKHASATFYVDGYDEGNASSLPSAVTPAIPSWEAGNFTDVGNASQVAQQAVKSESEAAVRYASVASQIKVPLQITSSGLSGRRIGRGIGRCQSVVTTGSTN